MMIDQQIQRCEVPVVAIVAGIDGTGGHIYGVSDPGVAVCYDRLGYHAVGSGETHALLHLIGTNHHRTEGLNSTVFSVYEAKRHAELAQGVGQETEMRIVSSNGIHRISAEELKQLADIYDQKVNPELDAVTQAIQSLPFGQEPTDDEQQTS